MASNPPDPLQSAQAVVASPPAGLITDVDGTVSPIADCPEDARVQPEARRALHRLTGRLALVAAVSGRPAAHVAQVVGVDGMVYAGNHGLEWWEAGRTTLVPEALPHLATVAATLEQLRASLKLPGVLVEEKGATGAVHYRLSPDAVAARQAILDAVAQCPLAAALWVREGRMVVEIRPPVRVDKGSAAETLVRQRRLQGVIYLGDNTTDLDAFRALRWLRESGVCRALLLGVYSPEAPPELVDEADFLLEGVEGAVDFLGRLAELLD